MKRFDLRHLRGDFAGRLGEIITRDLADGEVGIFIVEVGDFSAPQRAADAVKALGFTLLNSLRFNELDWMIVVKRVRNPQDSALQDSPQRDLAAQDSPQRDLAAPDSAAPDSPLSPPQSPTSAAPSTAQSTPKSSAND